MRIDILARRWGGPDGGPDGMAVASAFLAWTLCELGHDVRAYSNPSGPASWSHPRLDWRPRHSLYIPDDFDADLVISTISPAWHRTARAAADAGALDRLVCWHHHGGLPPGDGRHLAVLNLAVAGAEGWASISVLPPSSWAAEAGGDLVGDAILVPGAGATKGGYVARAVAALCPDLCWYVLPGRHAAHDLTPWQALPQAEVAAGPLPPSQFLARARAVLSPTRAEVHPLALVEASVRGIPIVCTDLPATRAACQESAIYVPVDSPAEVWARALREALERPLPRLQLRPYPEVVAAALERMVVKQRRRAVG